MAHELDLESSPEALSAIWAAGDPGRAALVVPDDRTLITYAELGERVERLAGILAGLGVERGSRVCLSLRNGPELIELILAIALAGAAAAPLNPALTRDELRFQLEAIRPDLLLTAEGRRPAVRDAAGHQPRALGVRPGGPRLDLDGGAATASFGPGEAGDTALVLHTSGTTSRPKLVALTQENLVASARSMTQHYRLTPDDVSYVAMPLFHVHGLVASTFAALLAGGTAVVPRRLAPGRVRAQLARDGVTWFSAAPTIHHMILERSGSAAVRRLPLRFVRSCSSALPTELLARAESVWRVPMLEAYGMTEASHEMTANPLPPGERRPGTVGVPTGAEIAIVDPSWSRLPNGGQGEVAIRGAGVTPGYLDNPEANAEAFREGWFRTGDLGVVEDGYLRLVGRIKELIIRGGENISPVEVENVLRSHRAVSDAAVFGLPDEKYGEVVVAAVSLRGKADDGVLRRHCRRHLTSAKVPVAIHVLDEIPRTATGKLQRRRIADSIDQP
jgi:oxalate---CoA ligase